MKTRDRDGGKSLYAQGALQILHVECATLPTISQDESKSLCHTNASCWIQPFGPQLDPLSCYCLSHQNSFSHSFCHSLLSFSHFQLLFFFFFFLKLTRFHAQPAKQPCFLCSRPCLCSSVGIMWGTSSEQRTTQATESVKIYANIQQVPGVWILN